MINVFQPALQREELEAVSRVFASNWVGKGSATDQFEAAFADHLKVSRQCICSLTCATEGLFQSMALLRVGSGDEVILPSISFVGAANAIASTGARPVFCDVDPRTLNTTADHIAAKTTSRTRAVMILHYGGLPCPVDEICRLVEEKKIGLIEDSACSVASIYKGKACGTFGDFSVWSFDAMKIVVAGDGGMLYSKNPAMAEQAKTSVYLGLAGGSGMERSSRSDNRWWQFEISCFGRRAIMNDILSAIGLEQLKKLPSFISRRRAVHECYSRALGELDWLHIPPDFPPWVESSYYFYWIQTTPNLRNKLAQFLRSRGIYTTFRYYPLHWVKMYGTSERLPGCERAALETLCIPIHHSLRDSEVETVIECIIQFGKTVMGKSPRPRKPRARGARKSRQPPSRFNTGNKSDLKTQP